jgi:hypothetical protein
VTSYRATLSNSWVRREPSLRGLAELLHEDGPVSLRHLLDLASTVETIHLACDITTDGSAIGGRADLVLRSDGSYVFSGYMRASGLTSYDFAVQTIVTGAGGNVLAAQRMGSVHGSDSVGNREDKWDQPGNNLGLVGCWKDLRSNPQLQVRMDATLSGVLGGALDVLTFALEGVVANLAVGPVGWILLIGAELAPRDLQPGTPDMLEGVLVAGGVLFVLGPFGVIPAAVAGLATAALSDVRHRPIHDDEIAFADRVFAGQIDYSNVVLTNLSHKSGTKYTIPSVGGRILVNLDDAFDAPMSYTSTNYPQPGSVFIHELTHAWQITHNSFVGMICGLSSDYDYRTDSDWPHGPWNGFGNEEQAHIVDDWYGNWNVADPLSPRPIYGLDPAGVPITDLDGPYAVGLPAFRFITENVRPGEL